MRGYTLAMSWSPQFCRSRNQGDSEQCDPKNGKFGFILHGLWPEGAGRKAPEYCAVPSVIPADVVRATWCVMPSTTLMAHEWARHGTCATRTPGDYFAAARKLFAFIQIPDMMALSRRRIDVGAFKRTIAALNPTVPPSALIVSTERRGDWLREVRICLGPDLRPVGCPRSLPGGAPDGAPVKIWRGE